MMHHEQTGASRWLDGLWCALSVESAAVTDHVSSHLDGESNREADVDLLHALLESSRVEAVDLALMPDSRDCTGRADQRRC